MRELIYFVASTLDGFIANENGSLDGFPSDDEYLAELFESFPETFPAHLRGSDVTRADNKLFDVVLMGRKTFEIALQEGITNPYPTLDQYVFSRTMTARPDPQVELVPADAIDVVKTLKKKAGQAIWLCGGADLATTLFAADLIDRLIVKLNPVVFGSGIPLFSGDIEKTALELTDCKIFASGHALLNYRMR